MSGEPLFNGDVWVTIYRNGVDGHPASLGEGQNAPESSSHSSTTERPLSLMVALVKGPGGGTDISLRLTDEEDPFFLYTMQLTLEDFSRLRQNQNLKVDFASFPANLVGLIKRCGRRDMDQSYVLELHGESEASPFASLSVVETNSFKNLVHLSLKLVPGTDSTIKKHLAGCLHTHKAEINRLRGQLSSNVTDLTGKLQQAQEEAVTAAAETAALKSEITNITARLTSEHAIEIARVREEAFAAKAAAQEQAQQARRAADEDAAIITNELRSKLAEVTKAETDKTTRLAKAETTLRDSQARLASAEDAAKVAQTELDAARAEVRALRTTEHESECTINEFRVRIAELIQEVKGKSELEKQQVQLTNAATEQKNSAEEKARRLENRCNEMEKRAERYASEIKKGNAIIARLQRDLAAVHSKLDARSAVVVKQEQVIGDFDKTRSRLERELASLTEELATVRRAEKEQAATFDQSAAELAETKRLLKNSEGIITWLNKQLNDAKRGQTVAAAREVATREVASRVPLGSRAVNVELNKKTVQYTRPSSNPLVQDKFFEPTVAKAVKSVDNVQSRIPRVPTAAE